MAFMWCGPATLGFVAVRKSLQWSVSGIEEGAMKRRNER